MRRIPLRL